jgi:hypothetical protein
MSEHSTTRRRFVAASASTVAGLAVFGTANATTPEWAVEETPVGSTLYDVARTSEGAYAVGSGGVVLARNGGRWQKVIDGGPTGNGSSLYACDTTDDGRRLWFVGASGAIGEYDPAASVLTDHSAPNDVTNNFNDVNVRGPADEANVYVGGDSGKIYYSFDDGATGTWGQVTPGSGSAINAVDFFDDRQGHAVDGNKTVFVTDDGSSYDKLGIADANVNFYGVDSDGDDAVTVVGGGGIVYDWDGSQWTRTDLGDAQLRDVEVCDCGHHGLTVGGGGRVFAKDGRWTQESTPTGQNLKAVSRGATDLAVGAGGIVVAKE